MDIETAAELIGAKNEEVVSVEEIDDGTVIRTVGGPPLIVVDGTVMLFGELVATAADGSRQVVETRLPVFVLPADDDEGDDDGAQVEVEAAPAKRPTKKAAAKPAPADDDEGDDD